MPNENGEETDWVRGPKRADVSKVNVHKIQEAHEQRGINVEVNADKPEESQVTKTVVSGLPAKPEKEEDPQP